MQIVCCLFIIIVIIITIIIIFLPLDFFAVALYILLASETKDIKNYHNYEWAQEQLSLLGGRVVHLSVVLVLVSVLV